MAQEVEQFDADRCGVDFVCNYPGDECEARRQRDNAAHGGFPLDPDFNKREQRSCLRVRGVPEVLRILKKPENKRSPRVE